MCFAGSGVYTNESYPLDEIFRVFMPISVGCLPNSEVTIPKWLRNASHAYSALVGKYHCGSNIKGGCAPTQAGGFDYYFGLLNSHEEGEAGVCRRHWRRGLPSTQLAPIVSSIHQRDKGRRAALPRGLLLPECAPLQTLVHRTPPPRAPRAPHPQASLAPSPSPSSSLP